MLGLAPLGKAPLGGVKDSGTVTVVTIGWFAPWSEPVRYRREPRAAVAVNNQSFAFNPLPVVSFGWFSPQQFSEPKRFKRGLPAPEQQAFAANIFPVVPFSWFNELSKPPTLQKRGLPAGEQAVLAFNPQPFVPFSWYGNLSEPVRHKRGLRAHLQQFYTGDTTVIPTSKLMEWFSPLSEPVRFKRGLHASRQQFLAAPSRLLPTPNITGTMAALETKDTFLAGAQKFNPPNSAEIGIVDTSFPLTEIGVIPSNAPGTIASVSISISIV